MATKLKPFKFLVQAVLAEVDDAGNTVGEHTHEPQVFYGVKALAEYAAGFERALAKALRDRDRALAADQAPTPNRAQRRGKQPASRPPRKRS